MMDQLFDGVLGVADANVEVATRQPGACHGACSGHDPLRTDQGAVALVHVSANGTAARIGTKTGLEQ